jgi:hypothetical protein
VPLPLPPFPGAVAMGAMMAAPQQRGLCLLQQQQQQR